MWIYSNLRKHGWLLAYLILRVVSMDAPCYGFGSLMGKVDEIVTSDKDMVFRARVGQTIDNNQMVYYIDSIDYFFDGRSYLSLNYRSSI
jgi:hypothetical protein